MNKALIITYYWPPNGGTGVQRWMHFARHLKNFGWDITVFTPENAEAAIVDDKLLEYVDGIKVVKTKIWEPLGLYKRLTGKKKKQKIQTGFLNEGKRKSKTEKFALWVRANYFIPDAKSFWINPSVKNILELQKKENFTHIISTGPPHSVHLIAQKIKEKTDIKWMADFRDPWTNIDWFPKLPLSKKSLEKHKKLELDVLKSADIVVSVTPTLSLEFEEIANRKVETITNGFEEDDFKNLVSDKTDKIIFFHHGSMNADRNPKNLWEFLADQVKSNQHWKEKLEIQCFGAVDQSIIQDIESFGLKNHLVIVPFIPHDQVLIALSKASICFLPVNRTQNAKGIMPNKLFEYIASEKPILLIGPKDGDASKLLTSQNHVLRIDFDERIEQNEIHKILHLTANKAFKKAFSRENLAKKIHEILMNINE